MDVRCTSTGKVFYQIDSQIGALLIEALPTVFERVEPVSQPKPKPLGKLNFRIDLLDSTGEPFIRFSCPACNQSGAILNRHPHGNPDNGKSPSQCAEESARAFRWGHCGKNEGVPEEFVAAFKREYTRGRDAE